MVYITIWQHKGLMKMYMPLNHHHNRIFIPRPEKDGGI